MTEDVLVVGAAGGMKKDGAKPQWALLPLDAVEEAVKVMTFGAEKYTLRLPVVDFQFLAAIPCTCERRHAIPTDSMQLAASALSATVQSTQKRNGLPATPPDRPSPEDCAASATTAGSKNTTRDTQRRNKKTSVGGRRPTVNIQGSGAESGTETATLTSSLYAPVNGLSQAMALLSQTTRAWSTDKTAGAQSAVAGRLAESISILTTCTELVMSAGFSAGDAIKALGCLEILRQALSGHSATCNARKVCYDAKSNVLSVSGAGNWKTVEAHRYVSALFRHMVAIEKGEKIDPDSGLPHISHVLCNAVFLTWFELHGGIKLDLPEKLP